MDTCCVFRSTERGGIQRTTGCTPVSQHPEVETEGFEFETRWLHSETLSLEGGGGEKEKKKWEGYGREGYGRGRVLAQMNKALGLIPRSTN